QHQLPASILWMYTVSPVNILMGFSKFSGRPRILMASANANNSPHVVFLGALQSCLGLLCCEKLSVVQVAV
ncbi:MAG: hypothetical protein Q4Q37_05210, partial [Methanobrevibacter sp.]|nr:hypothetical protein [Methanobrevibacter sp.]